MLYRGKEMKFVYGPVKSRRLGSSLGLTVTPFKVCSFDCVYCQLGRTSENILERREFFSPEEILSELRVFLASVDPRTQPINYITISGSGEPTLNSRLGEIIRGIKKITTIPVCVITNSSLLKDPKVREELAAADVLMPTLNAVSIEVFAKVCRAHAGVNLENIIQGLIALRKECRGKIFLEIMLVKGINDRIAEIRKMKAVVDEITPDKIYLTLPSRETCEQWVRPPGLKTLQKIKEILGEKCEVV